MRALLAGLLLLAAAAPAAARPLDADRSFARNGVFRLDQPDASTSAVALPEGGSLHVTAEGIMRLTAAGRLGGFHVPQGGTVQHVTGGLAVGFGTVAYGRPTPLATWKLEFSGATAAPRIIPLTSGESAHPLAVVPRRGGYAMLVYATTDHPKPSRALVVALTEEGALDTAWGDGGIRHVPKGNYSDTAIAAAPDGSVLVPVSRCERVGGRRRSVARLLRFAPGGKTSTRRRLFMIAPARGCAGGEFGDALVDGRGRTVIAGRLGLDAILLRLHRDLKRDRSFTASVRMRGLIHLPVRMERWPGRGYALAFTDSLDRMPRATVALVDYQARRRAVRRLKVTRSHPTADLRDIVLDARRRLVAGGSLRDTATYTREDYGRPHLAVWSLKTR
jgi:hypothetical protein